MALDPRRSAAAANAACNAFAALFNNGYLRIYDGAKPAGPGTALSGQVLLAELRFGATAFGNASSGVATANAVTSGVAGNSGTASWFRALASDGTTAHWDGTVGTATSDCIVPTVAISAGITVSVTSMTLSEPL